eukprot:TRINITY_DN14038_c0_g1_i1.p1 TRINITY_DN14038_c0_g1~~TRINITY_DN14038_c0_g1_i1.p1  ORF type:complete len:137 (+),score=38.31 TRINITY_DN14038_c0_g1_i1:30-413(+)
MCIRDRGKLVRSVSLELKAQNKYPVARREWEVVTTTRRLLHKAEAVLPGTILGQEFDKEGRRVQTVEAVCSSRLLFVPLSVYSGLFSEEEREKLEEGMNVMSAMQAENAGKMLSREYIRNYKVSSFF